MIDLSREQESALGSLLAALRAAKESGLFEKMGCEREGERLCNRAESFNFDVCSQASEELRNRLMRESR